ncbi:MAG: bifunctional phosphoribosyl-AMP cyclohydrolase/phosphoribosyl-ATP diphosphatase HisIE [Myxococcaceae bacterium]|nr:bifunctional phosphoribosyl-AMP cyclohydrolase/phosphoribosyl-ATP diphosphatase HisIE [Myxococcaceae bacterium]
MRWLEAVTEVARVAGGKALSYFRRGVTVETKADGTPVTVADREAEFAARAWIAAHFPEDGIVGEEGDSVRPDARRRWYVDPIDGTKAFVRGVPLWGTLVAVAEGDEVLAGALFCPALDELVAAERGRGCFFNGAPTRVSAVASLDAATVLTTDAGRLARPLRPLLDAAPVSRTWGDCYGYLLLATGRAEVMVDPVLNDWDSAALWPIIEEAGGVFTALDGTRTGFGKSAIATNAPLASVVRELVTPKAQPQPAFDVGRVDFSKGLVPVVTQDALTGAVLMVAYADAEALTKTVETGFMHYRSRTRGLWKKGDTSGHVQRVVSLALDCDADTVLARVEQTGPACHTNAITCFGAPTGDELSTLAATIAARAKAGSDASYTAKLLGNRNLRLKKLGEEAAELVLALADGDDARAAEEGADVLYHTLVALQGRGLTLDDVRQVLRQRARR